MSHTFIFRHEPSFAHEPLRWAWALAAHFNIGQGWPVDLPVAPDAAAHGYAFQLDQARGFLAGDWDVTDRASLVGRLVDLGRAGRRRHFRALVRRLCALPSGAWQRYEANDLAAMKGEPPDPVAAQRLWRMWAVQKDLGRCRTASFLAFDAANGVVLARCGFALGWLSHDEMRAYLYDLAREASAGFDSWEAFAADFEIGRAFANGAAGPGPWPEIFDLLRQDARSPWRRMPFAFPETDESRAITSHDATDGPYWTLETLHEPSPLAFVPEAAA